MSRYTSISPDPHQPEKQMHTYEYPRPAVTVDCVVFGYDLDTEELSVLAIKRGEDPHKGSWALPGGFVEIDEPLETAAARELEEETGLDDIYLEQLFTFGSPQRDPRGRIISVAYYALVDTQNHDPEGGSDAAKAQWVAASKLEQHEIDMAFDHQQVFDTALKRLRAKVTYSPVGFELLPDLFTMRQVQRLHETILDTSLDRRMFRYKMDKLGIIEKTDQKEENVNHRPACLYRLKESTYTRYVEEAYPFEL